MAKAVEYGKRIQLYPLSPTANPPQTTFVAAIKVIVSGVRMSPWVYNSTWIPRSKAARAIPASSGAFRRSCSTPGAFPPFEKYPRKDIGLKKPGA